jgi:hypothetical protein
MVLKDRDRLDLLRQASALVASSQHKAKAFFSAAGKELGRQSEESLGGVWTEEPERIR